MSSDVVWGQSQMELQRREQRTQSVYRKMWQQSLGSSRVKRAIDQICDFLTAGVEPDVAVKAFEVPCPL